MSDVVHSGKAQVTVKHRLDAIINCPNCDAPMTFDAHKVDIGNTVKCGKCDHKTYYPFERPWYRNTKMVIGFVLSLLLAIAVGVVGNYIYGWLKAGTACDSVKEQGVSK